MAKKLSIILSRLFHRFYKRSSLDNINERSSVTDIQCYIREMVVARGFDQETPQDVLLLMVEEVGELAKALRCYLGLKTDQERQDQYPTLEGELADVFIYLLDLSNLLQISLFQAFWAKEEDNKKRSWR